MLTGCMWLRSGTNDGLFEHGNEPSVSIKGVEYID